MNWFLFFLYTLSVYRLSLMLSKESGPGRIFRKLRQTPPPRSSLREGLSCLFCESIWLAGALTLIMSFAHYIVWRDSWLWWLAGSAGAVILNQVFTRGDLS